MKYYIIAGEASGDLHASNLIRELKKHDEASHFRCWGGEMMQAQGAEIVKHYKDLAFMGFLEVISNLRTILKNIDFCKKDILSFQPDVIILVDYPGFNLRIAAFAHLHKFKVVYYISPQIWAWKQSRVKAIKRDVDLMLVILPFEKEFYGKHGMEVNFVGHPLLDAIAGNEKNQDSNNYKSGKATIALLPGSRKQEIKVMLPLMLKATSCIKEYEVVIAGAPSIPPAFYNDITGNTVKIVYNQTYPLLAASTAALVTSGTATLESALFKVPQVVCYKGNMISYTIARKLIKIKYISLVNLILDKEVVKELIQDALTKENLQNELSAILPGGNKRSDMLQSYNELRTALGDIGASERAATLIRHLLNG